MLGYTYDICRVWVHPLESEKHWCGPAVLSLRPQGYHFPWIITIVSEIPQNNVNFDIFWASYYPSIIPEYQMELTCGHLSHRHTCASQTGNLLYWMLFCWSDWCVLLVIRACFAEMSLTGKDESEDRDKGPKVPSDANLKMVSNIMVLKMLLLVISLMLIMMYMTSMKTIMNDYESSWKTSQELRMLSSVTINCQVPKIVMN